MEEKLRRQAVIMVGQGVSVTEVARQLGKSRQWVYKWIERGSTGEPDWNISPSNKPHSIANKTHKDIESAVMRIRRILEVDPTGSPEPIRSYLNSDDRALSLRRQPPSTEYSGNMD